MKNKFSSRILRVVAVCLTLVMLLTMSLTLSSCQMIRLLLIGQSDFKLPGGDTDDTGDKTSTVQKEDYVQNREVFCFDANGNRLNKNKEFVSVNDNIYYPINNIAVVGFYIIDGSLYYFDVNGVLTKPDDTMVTYNADGKVKTVCGVINNDGKLYFFIDGEYFNVYKLSGTVKTSAADESTVANVKVGVQCGSLRFETLTGANGAFAIAQVPGMSVNVKLSVNDEDKASYTFVIDADTEKTLYLDGSDGTTGTDVPGSSDIGTQTGNGAKFTGKVVMADSDLDSSNNTPLVGATVKISGGDLKADLTVTTDSNGVYTFEKLMPGTYTLTISMPGYTTITQNVEIFDGVDSMQNQLIELVVATSAILKGNANGTVVDSTTGKGIAGLTLYLREGVNNDTGASVAQTFTNTNGYYEFKDIPAGIYTMQIKDDRNISAEDARYGTINKTIKIVGNATISNQDVSVACATEMITGSIRVVLEWGEKPQDLDAILKIETPDDGENYVYWKNKTYKNIGLDVDDRNGIGPETITIKSTEAGSVYTYYVEDFTYRENEEKDPAKSDLPRSGATVRIYVGASATPKYTLTVPDGIGTHWYLFTYYADTNQIVFTNVLLDK